MNNSLHLGKVSDKTYVSFAIGAPSDVVVRKIALQFVRNERRSKSILLAMQNNRDSSEEDGKKGRANGKGDVVGR